ncbi:MAG: hypothetical protein IJV01_04145 [Bacteroidales bacterium]|nr:hypothetical protein [Bacteroidales bacterium]
MEQFDALDVIARTRGKVDMDGAPNGDRLFLLWGSLTAFFYLLEFLLWQVLHRDWCFWLWIGIPLLGLPLMSVILRRDHERKHMRTHGSRLVLDYWIFTACAIGAGGFLFGFFDLYEVVENPMICLLVGIGAFITGEVLRFRPMIAGGLVGAAVGVGAFLLQGELWVWQVPCIVLTAVASLIVPGLLFNRSMRYGV